MDHHLHLLRSASELRASAAAWDDLWQRSDVSSPLARAQIVAQWLERFAPAAAFRGLAVEADGRLVAALPLVGRRLGPFVEVGGMPSNSWGLCGDLLVDPRADVAAATHALAAGLDELPWPLISLSPVPCEAPHWRALAAAASRNGLAAAQFHSEQVGQVELAGRWDDYRRRWSGNHRRQMRKAERRARLTGKLSLEVCAQLQGGQVEELLRRGCEIEDRSWKGAAGTSILRTPGMFDWFCRQARQLADWGHLQLTFLKLDGRPIAFEYGYRAKGTYFSPKVGYDPAYAALSPGQLLRSLLFEQFFHEQRVGLVDFWGPLSDATARWATTCYPVGKLLVAPDRLLSKLGLRAYGVLRPCWQGARFILRPQRRRVPSVRAADPGNAPFGEANVPEREEILP